MKAKTIATGENLPMYGFRAITKWALWGGVAMMDCRLAVRFLLKAEDPYQCFQGNRSVAKKKGKVKTY